MIILADILNATVLFAVPLILVALGGMFSERSGIINIALEGIMIVGALVSCLFLSAVDKSGFGPANPQLSMLLAILIASVSGMVYSALLAFASINLKANQTIGGVALNMLAPAFAIVLTWAIQGQGNTTIFIPTWTRISAESIGVTDISTFLPRFLFKSFYLTTPAALLLLLASILVLYRTRLGLRLRSCGEHPQAADSVGINVYKMRYIGVLISGFLGGIGGLAFTLAAGSGFQSQVAGYGFLALAVMIFGNWKPLNIFLASLLKSIILRYAGPKVYQRSIPFFLGLVLGQLTAGGVWLVIDFITKTTGNKLPIGIG